MPEPGKKLTLQGVIVGNRADKTIKVEVITTKLDAFYGRLVKKRKNYAVHDSKNQGKVGDSVIIVQCPPVSRTKAFKLLKITRSHSNEATKANKTNLEVNHAT